MGKAPLLQLKVCSTENAFPQMQLVSKKGGVHPYLRKTVSLNALLCRVKPMFSMGSVFSQEEAPFSPARDRDLHRLQARTQDFEKGGYIVAKISIEFLAFNVKLFFMINHARINNFIENMKPINMKHYPSVTCSLTS